MKNLLETTRAVKPNRRQAAALTLAGVAAAGVATSANAASSDIRTVSAAQRAADQQRLLDLINAFRAQNGLNPVRHSATVASVMEIEAIRQFNAGYFSHGTQFLYNSKVQGYSFVREVIALTYNDDISQLLAFWKSSPAHRAAVLAPQANVMGIGLCYGHGTNLPWRILGNVGIYRYDNGRGPNDYTSSIVAPQSSAPVQQVSAIPMSGNIASHYHANGGEATFGLPATAEFGSINGGRIQNFTKGRTIYWSPTFGAHNVYWPGAIGGKYAANRFEFGWGYPMNSEHPYLGGMRQDFSKDGFKISVFWTEATGARSLVGHGAIYYRWHDLGGPTVLGFPVTDEVRGGDGVTRVTFASGITINWTEARGTWES
ncbi:CAP domain-containing protein [Rothia nasimurium]|uniref:CAP domain-containing protein n=1 Tax=Rothia nasimurium TaxID=85336 RepID=UPI001F4130C5|nr:CAP domain-containing protein [Rothia nasimurium]